jgi:hypothetical protein
MAGDAYRRPLGEAHGLAPQIAGLAVWMDEEA